MSTIVRFEVPITTVKFKVATGLQVIKSLLEEFDLVGNSTFELSAMDKVEFILEYPIMLEVVDFELTVWWNPISI